MYPAKNHNYAVIFDPSPHIGPLDFTSVEQLLLFNETVMSYEIDVVIADDGLAELNEYFLALLTLVDPLLPGKVTIRPDLATVTIIDGKAHFCLK